MEPDQHGQTAAGERPVGPGDGQVETVLAGGWRGRGTERRRHSGRRRALPGDCRNCDRLPDAEPGLWMNGRSVPELSDRRRAERHPAPDEHAVRLDASHPAGAGGDLGIRILHSRSLPSPGLAQHRQGSCADTVVPRPGWLDTVSRPPSASTRSASPRKPDPRSVAAPPIPSSAMSITARWPSARTSIATLDACACLATLASASEATKYAANSTCPVAGRSDRSSA